jgi:hypothetical protein
MTNSEIEEDFMKTAEVLSIRELDVDELDTVSGGDKARDAAVIEAYKLLDQMELDEIEVEPVPYVPMKL